MTDQILSPSELWARTVEVVKLRVNSRSLWETLEKAVGIVIEGDVFIVGLNPGIFNLAGHLTVSEHRNAIEHALEELAGRRLRIRVIEGETLGEWVAVKERDQRIKAMREATYERKDRQAEAAASWDSVYEHVARAYSATPLRQLPQSKARYLADMLYVLSDAVDELYPNEAEDSDETMERHLARIIDRVATNAGVPSTLVALELQRLRTWRKGQVG